MSKSINKELRVLHSAALLAPSSGMLSQMDFEKESAIKQEIPWQVKMYCPNNTDLNFTCLHIDKDINSRYLQNPLLKALSWIKLRYRYHKWLLNQQDSIDIFLLRYYVHDPFQLWFVKTCKKPIYFVHHSLEVPELSLEGGARGYARAYLEKILGPICIKNATGIIAMTNEIAEYEAARVKSSNIKKFIHPNGIAFEKSNLSDKRSNNIPEFLFVANFSSWHGLDILLKSIENSEKKFILHLVGSIPKDQLIKIQDERVKIHGPLNRDQILKLSESCWIGLASFALSRKKMKQACPLKVREYLLLGLPAYGDYDDVFPNDAIFYKKGNENIDNLINYAFNVRSISKNKIADSARIFIDKDILLKKLYNELRTAHNTDQQ